MIAGIQTFGDLINWHPHSQLFPKVFLASGTFCPIDTVTDEMFCNRREQKVFAFLKKACLITDEVIDSMKSWKFSVVRNCPLSFFFGTYDFARRFGYARRKGFVSSQKGEVLCVPETG